MKILKAEMKKSKDGQYTFVKFDLAITDDPTYSGRRFFPTVFPSPQSLKTLRRLADNTGVMQEPGTPITEWLKTLSEVQPEFRTRIRKHEDRKFVKGDKGVPSGEVKAYKPDGTPEVINTIDWFEIHPA